MGKRIYPLSRIMYWYCYDIEEICHLYKSCNLHPQTVRGWVKQGLETVDSGTPLLIYGNNLKSFLGKLNESHKCQTAFGEMFCCKCRDARHPYQKCIQLNHEQQFVRAKARCKVCKTLMNKAYKLDDIPRLLSLFRTGDVLELYDSTASTVKTHFDDQAHIQENEPAQRELFQ